jgi:hypothetical protein
MSVRKKMTIGAAVIVAAILAAGTLKINLSRVDSGGNVLWNANEAYLFIATFSHGVRVTYLEYSWMILKEYLGGIRAPDNNLSSLTVIRVTPSTVERYNVDQKDGTPGSGPNLYTPFEHQIYANCPALGGLCRWAGNRFEPASEEDRLRLNGTSRLRATNYANVDGWSEAAIGAGPENIFARFATEIGGRFAIFEEVEPIAHSGYAAVSIYVQRPGEARTKIWYLDGHPRTINRTEYEHVFGGHR